MSTGDLPNATLFPSNEPIPYEPAIEAVIDDAARHIDLASAVGGSQTRRLERFRAILRSMIATIAYLKN